MNVKKFVLAWVAATVVAFLLGGLWHQFLLVDFYGAQTQDLAREEPIMAFVMLGYLILAFLMALGKPCVKTGPAPVGQSPSSVDGQEKPGRSEYPVPERSMAPSAERKSPPDIP